MPGMSPATFEMRLCQNPACGLRYPLTEGHPFGERCPLCLGPTQAALTRSIHPEPAPPPNQPGIWLEALLDNLRSAWNVGAIFRTADGLGLRKLHLCGITPTPENAQVRKTALGAEENVAWAHHRNALMLAGRLKNEGATLWALEQDARATPLGEACAMTNFVADKRIVLMVGNEVTGVDPAMLDLCERIVHIPMLGRKRSLNVEVAFGIAAWALRSQPLV